MAPDKSIRAVAIKALAWIVFFSLMAGALWLVARPVYWAFDQWGVLGAWAVVPFIAAAAWFADKWLDKVSDKRRRQTALELQYLERVQVERLAQSDDWRQPTA